MKTDLVKITFVNGNISTQQVKIEKETEKRFYITGDWNRKQLDRRELGQWQTGTVYCERKDWNKNVILHGTKYMEKLQRIIKANSEELEKLERNMEFIQEKIQQEKGEN